MTHETNPADDPETAAAPAPQLWVVAPVEEGDATLYGHWINAARSTEEIRTDIRAMFADAPTHAHSNVGNETWRILDYQGFTPYVPTAEDTLHRLSAVARGIAEHGPAFAAWANLVDDDTDFARFTDAYLGEYASLGEFAARLLDDNGYTQLLAERLDEVIPPLLRPFVGLDVQQLGEQMWLGGEIRAHEKPGGGIWLFDGIYR